MAAGRSILAAIVISLSAAGCGKSVSTHTVGYSGYTPGSSVPGSATVTPPSSGTSNGTGEAIPSAAK